MGEEIAWCAASTAWVMAVEEAADVAVEASDGEDDDEENDD